MSKDERAEWAERLRPILAERLVGMSLREIAAEVPGVSYGTLNNLVNGVGVPSERTLILVDRWLRSTNAEMEGSGPETSRGVSSRPIQLLATIELPEGVRRQSGVPRIRSLFAHVYAIGVSEGFSDAELAVLEKWRDAEVDRARGENGS